MRLGLAIGITALLPAGLQLLPAQQKNDPLQELTTKVQQLEERIRALEGKSEPAILRMSLRAPYDSRTAQDLKTHSRQEVDEIEKLYQEAQSRGVWGTPAAVEKLKALTSKYKSLNRVGCAFVYLGQLTTGEERELYLKKAIAEYSDSWWGDGVQVGAFARFLLARDYLDAGRKIEADDLLNYVRAHYPDAIDHAGAPLSKSIAEMPHAY